MSFAVGLCGWGWPRCSSNRNICIVTSSSWVRMHESRTVTLFRVELCVPFVRKWTRKQCCAHTQMGVRSVPSWVRMCHPKQSRHINTNPRVKFFSRQCVCLFLLPHLQQLLLCPREAASSSLIPPLYYLPVSLHSHKTTPDPATVLRRVAVAVP